MCSTHRSEAKDAVENAFGADAAFGQNANGHALATRVVHDVLGDLSGP